jgi:6-pyruvoyltetrahydropterin/6-carboxytetrahydropterin synthase
MPIAYLTRVVAFTATHRIARADWTEERNAATFGRAAQDHAHRYECRVTVKGPLVAGQGGVVNLTALDALLAREITDRLEGQHINRALPEFADGQQLTTGEALAVYFWGRLATALPSGVQLHAIRVQEGPHLYSEYFGEA